MRVPENSEVRRHSHHGERIDMWLKIPNKTLPYPFDFTCFSIKLSSTTQKTTGIKVSHWTQGHPKHSQTPAKRTVTSDLADEVEAVESGHHADWHPGAQAAGDDLRLDAREEAQRHEVGQADGHHVRPDGLGHGPAHGQAACRYSEWTLSGH